MTLGGIENTIIKNSQFSNHLHPSPPSHRSWVRNSSSVVAPGTHRPPSRRPPPPVPPPPPRSPEAAPVPATPGAASGAPGCGGSRRLLGTPGPAPWLPQKMPRKWNDQDQLISMMYDWLVKDGTGLGGTVHFRTVVACKQPKQSP